MKQAEVSSRPVVGAIVRGEWPCRIIPAMLLYVHHASATSPAMDVFCRPQRALQWSCAITLCVGLYFIKHHNIPAHRTSMLLAFAFYSVFLVATS